METTARNDYNSEPVDAFTFPLICFFQCREMGMKTLKRFDEKSGLLPKPYTASVHPSVNLHFSFYRFLNPKNR